MEDEISVAVLVEEEEMKEGEVTLVVVVVVEKEIEKLESLIKRPLQVWRKTRNRRGDFRSYMLTAFASAGSSRFTRKVFSHKI